MAGTVFSGTRERAAQQSFQYGLQKESDLAASWGEIARTAKQSQILEGNISSRRSAYYDYLNENMAQAGLQLDLIEMDYMRQTQRGEITDAEVPDILEIYRQNEAAVIAAGGKSLDEIGAQVRADIEESRLASESAMLRSEDYGFRRVTGGLAGSFVGTLNDPAQVLSFMSGTRYMGGSIAGFALKEGAIEMGIATAIEAGAQDVNQPWIEDLGLEYIHGWEDIAMVAGTTGGLQFVLSALGAKVTSVRGNRAVEEIQQALNEGRVPEQWAVSRVGDYLRTGYGFDFLQRRTIDALGVRLAQRAAVGRALADYRALSPVTGRVIDVPETVERSINAAFRDMERKAAGLPEPARQPVSLAPVSQFKVDIDVRAPESPLQVRLSELEAKVDQRLKIEKRDTPSKPLRRLQRELDDVRQKIASQEAKADKVLKLARSTMSDRTSVLRDLMELDFHAGKTVRDTRAEYDGARRILDEADKRVADIERRHQARLESKTGKSRASRKRNQASYERAIEKARAIQKEARRNLEEARATRNAAINRLRETRERIKLARNEKRMAEQAYNDLLATREGAAEASKGIPSFRYVAPKTDKGAPARALDIVDSAGDPSASPRRGPQSEREAPKSGGVDDGAYAAATKKADEIAARTEPVDGPAGEAFKMTSREYRDAVDNVKGMEEVIACVGG